MEQWTVLVERSKLDGPEPPKLTKQLPMLPWVDAFEDFLSRKIGHRKIPLSYVIRENDEVAPAGDFPLMPGAGTSVKPYSAAHGSVEGELIARSSHDHGVFPQDNA